MINECLYNSCSTPEKPSVPLQSEVANNMTIFFIDVVMCRHTIYNTQFSVFLSNVPTMFFATTFNILYVYYF